MASTADAAQTASDSLGLMDYYLDSMSNESSDTVEMRGDVPRDLYDVFDAVRMARGITKQALLVRIVAEWAHKEVHVSNVVGRLTRGKAIGSPPTWGVNGD